MFLEQLGLRSREAFEILFRTDSETRREAVHTLADELEACYDEVRSANAVDIQLAREQGLAEPLIDRLTLTEARLTGLVAEVHALADLPDPVGTTYDERTLANGLRISRQRVPFGVLGVIYESRPNVTIDVAALVLKPGTPLFFGVERRP